MLVQQFTDFVVLLQGRSPAPLPPRRDPKTTLSVGRARARSMVTGLGKPHSFIIHSTKTSETMAAQSWGCTRTLSFRLGRKVILQVVAGFSNQWISWPMNDISRQGMVCTVSKRNLWSTVQ
jgi:hypothetical protein